MTTHRLASDIIPNRPAVPPEDWDRAPWNRWTFQHVREMVPTTPVRRGGAATHDLPRDTQAIDRIPFKLDDQSSTIGAFLDSSFTDGFIVLHHGRIVSERYMNGMTERTQHLSQSVAKSVTGKLQRVIVAV